MNAAEVATILTIASIAIGFLVAIIKITGKAGRTFQFFEDEMKKRITREEGDKMVDDHCSAFYHISKEMEQRLYSERKEWERETKQKVEQILNEVIKFKRGRDSSE